MRRPFSSWSATAQHTLVVPRSRAKTRRGRVTLTPECTPLRAQDKVFWRTQNPYMMGLTAKSVTAGEGRRQGGRLCTHWRRPTAGGPLQRRRATVAGARRAVQTARAAPAHGVQDWGMRIDAILESRHPVFSFEFSPPRTDEGVASLFSAIAHLRELGPAFVSVTYGAG
ncbi:MAG: methylenetetrahydrofolate reductase, partial [Candidatus Dormibacteria bacterium]